MEIQEPIKLAMSQSPDSWKKRLVAQPLNGSSTITIGTSSSTQTRIEIPSCCNYIGDMEIGYQMALSAPVVTNKMVFLPATFLPEIQRIEMYFADSTSKLIDIQNLNIYSRMTTSLFNDYKKRTVAQRLCFSRDKSISNLVGGAGVSSYMFSNSGVTGEYKFTGVVNSNFQLSAAYTFPNGGPSFTGENPSLSTLAQGVTFQIPGTNIIITGTSTGAASSPTWNQATGYVYTIYDGVQIYQTQETVNGNYINTNALSTEPNSDGYFSDSIARTLNGNVAANTHESSQQQYLPMGYFSSNGANAVLTPIQYNFNFKLKDVIHDSILSNLKCMYHRANLVLIIYWQPVSQIVFQVPTKVAVTTGAVTSGPVKNGVPESYTLAPTLNITNLFVRYYSEINPMLCEQIKNATYEIAYPFLYQYNMSLEPGVSQGSVLGGNLIIGNEGASRIYRVYTGLQGLKGSYLPIDNFGNIQYKKWNNLMELYLNNDLIERLTAAYGDWDATMGCFKDGSINSTVELQNLGTIAYNLDSDTKNGSSREYDDNVLKGKPCDQFININPRFTGIGSDGATNPTASYTIWVYAVIIRKAIIDKGEMKLV